MEDGLAYFRDLEAKLVCSLASIRNHVISVGGGTLEKDESFYILKSLGLLVWVDTTPMVIAWRLHEKLQELKKRPLLSDLCNVSDRMQRYERLKTRLETLHSERLVRYSEASLVLRDSVSAPEVCARKLIYFMDSFLSQKKGQAQDLDD